MKRLLMILLILLVSVNSSCAEGTVINIVDSIDMSGLESFAEERNGIFSLNDIRNMISQEGFPDIESLKQELQRFLSEPLSMLAQKWSSMIMPSLILALMGALLPGKRASSAFVCRILIAQSGTALFETVLQSAAECLETTAAFSDTAAPVLTAVLTATGKTGSAALIAPSAALVGNMIENIFLKYGLPLCACTGCLALAANLSETLDLGNIVRLLKKLFSWGSGLVLVLFTALIFLKGSAASISDNLALRTAKYAVDSASPVIGSGVSDAWETYLAGLSITRSTVGFSGVVVLLSVCIKPLISMGLVMIGLSLLSTAFQIFGEKQCAKAFDQLSGACQMAMTLCGGATAIWVILMGSMLSLGGWFV